MSSRWGRAALPVALLTGLVAGLLGCGADVGSAEDVAGGDGGADVAVDAGPDAQAADGDDAQAPDLPLADALPGEAGGDDEDAAPDDAQEAEADEDAMPEALEAPLIVIRPDVPHLAVGPALPLTAWRVAQGAQPQDVTDQVAWASADGAVAAVDEGGRIEALAPGQARVSASLEGAEAGVLAFPVLPAHQVEVRALWVTRWQFTTPGDVIEILDEARDAGMNVVFLQVRGRFDACYRSSLEPWAKELTGTLGQDPGWDPLRLALDEGHARGLQVHAWINVFSLWSGSTAPASAGLPHPLNAHPEWLMVDQAGAPMPLGSGEYVWASPGLAAVRDWNVAVVQDLVTSYPDLDGVHLDRIRYPGPDYSYDAESLQGLAAAQALDPSFGFDDYRRQRVDEQVAAIRNMLSAVAPDALLSAAVAANYQNPFAWGSVSVGCTGHFQDSRAWLDAGTIDWVCPMAYWPLTDPYGARTDFAALTDDWLLGRPWADQIVMGLSADYGAFQEIDDEIAWVRARAGRGVALYDRAALLAQGHYPALATGPVADPALIPFAWWRADSGPPAW